MNISFLGAAREVTGSCYFVETKKSRLLIDCGMFQGSAYAEARNFEPFPFDPKTIDAVILTHAHEDHIGRLPKLYKEGFRGAVYATPPTLDLAAVILKDAEHIMREEFERLYRPPLFDQKDVDDVMKLARPIFYDERLTINDVAFSLHQAGHIFGSAFIEVVCEEKTLIFSGDLGNVHDPLLPATAPLPEADILIIESTYGNRTHENVSQRVPQLREAIMKTIEQNGVLIIPAFAIERTQQLLFELHDLMEQNLIPHINTYLDSPMAIAATKILRHYPSYVNTDVKKHLTQREDLFQFPGLHVTATREESKTINNAPRPKVIIAGSGMMNGGRILHHLRRTISDPACTIMIVGYQAKGTLGRQLERGDQAVTVLGDPLSVRATILKVGTYSAHADQHKLFDWVSACPKKPSRILCTHGDEEAAITLANYFHEQLGVEAYAPHHGETITV